MQQRVREFCDRFGLRFPVLQAPMAGACPPELAIAVAQAGGMGADGVVLDPPERIADWVDRFRAASAGAFQLNIWIPDPVTADPARVDAARSFLGRFGTPGEPGPAAPVFAEQCEAMLAAALALGATAVQVGTALLRSPEAGIDEHRSASLEGLAPERTITTRAYSGRLGRAAPTPYVLAWTDPDAPRPAPYPAQRRLVAQWRRGRRHSMDSVNFWAGQSAHLATDDAAATIVTRMWQDARQLLGE
jgi:NAD(P)H-dependent flavin oxidoreductase YrpB (nitropropane dioxygenase family)